MTKTQEIVDYFTQMGKHVFTLNDVSKLTFKRRDYLSRLLCANAKIRKIERNKYYITGAEVNEVASNIVEPSYVSLMAAFRFYDLTTQVPAKVSVVTTKRHKGVVFENMRIEFRTVNRRRVFGYKRIGNIMIASPEKAILDSLYLREPSYADVEEALEMGLRAKSIDVRKLMNYAKEMESGVLVNRLGFILEDIGVDATYLHKYKSRVKALLYGRGRNENKRWNIRYD